MIAPIDNRPSGSKTPLEYRPRNYVIAKDTFLVVKSSTDLESDEFESILFRKISSQEVGVIATDKDDFSNANLLLIQNESDLEGDALKDELESDNQIELVTPSLINEYGDISPVDPRKIIVSLTTNSAVERSRFARDYDLNLVWHDYNGGESLYRHKEPKLLELLEKLNDDDRVLFAEPDILDYIDVDEDDLDYVSDLENNAAEKIPSFLWNHELIELTEANKLSKGKGVIIAVVDALSDLNHPDLQGVFLSTSDQLNFAKELSMRNHGTRILGIIAGQTRLKNGKVLGISPKAKILPLAIHPAGLEGYSIRAKAINFLAAIARRKRWYDASQQRELKISRLIVNCSWKLKTTRNLIAMEEAFKRLVNAGAIVVCSAGNKNIEQVHFPSDYPGCLSIAAVQSNNSKNSSSNYGYNIDLSAPGGDGFPSDSGDIWSLKKGGKYGYAAGTSFAAPHVSATIALIWSLMPDASAQQVLQLLREYGLDDINRYNSNLEGKLGEGRVNAKRAVEAASRWNSLRRLRSSR